MFRVLTAIRLEGVSNMVMNVRNSRSLAETNGAEGIIHTQKGLLEETNRVITQKRKESLRLKNIVTKGNAIYLLKRSDKLNVKRKPAKEYQLNI